MQGGFNSATQRNCLVRIGVGLRIDIFNLLAARAVLVGVRVVPEASILLAVLIALSKRLIADPHVSLPFLAVIVLFHKLWFT